MADWLSAEQPLMKAIMEHLYASPLSLSLDGHIYDKAQIDIESDSYIIVGETNTIEQENSQGNHETIAVTFHVYHRNPSYPELAVDETRQLMRWLKFYAQKKVVMDHYIIEWIKLDYQSAFEDVDLVTQHGVVRLKYKIRHLLRSEV